MAGGPFLNGGRELVPAVDALIRDTRTRAPLLALADALRELDELLAREGAATRCRRCMRGCPSR